MKMEIKTSSKKTSPLQYLYKKKEIYKKEINSKKFRKNLHNTYLLLI